MLSIDDIELSPEDQRKVCTGTRMNELVESIKEYGIISPIVVNNTDKGYKLLSGGSRLEAARIAGLKEIETIITDISGI